MFGLGKSGEYSTVGVPVIACASVTTVLRQISNTGIVRNVTVLPD